MIRPEQVWQSEPEAAVAEQQEASQDAVMTRIGQAVILLHAGDREEARNRLGEIWSEIGEEGDSLHRCTLAHYMADAQDDPADELAWDLRALTAAADLPDELPDDLPGDQQGGRPGTRPPRDGRPARREPHPELRVFYPSLHLNLAADYVKLQRPEAARVHLARARAATGALSDDGYGNGVRAAIARLERRLAAEPEAGPGPGPGSGPGPRPFPEQSP